MPNRIDPQDLVGTTGDIREDELCEQEGIDLGDLEDYLLKFNIERCPECEWWVYSCELADDENEPCSCSTCRDVIERMVEEEFK